MMVGTIEDARSGRNHWQKAGKADAGTRVPVWTWKRSYRWNRHLPEKTNAYSL